MRDATHLTKSMFRSKGRTSRTFQIHHRTHLVPDVETEEQLSELVNRFRSRELGTGSKFPYHYVVSRSGIIWHVVPLKYSAPAAAGYNEVGVQVAWEGDFRVSPPSAKQYDAGAWLAQYLEAWGATKVRRHDELPNASADPDKICPGKHLKVEELLRHRVAMECIP